MRPLLPHRVASPRTPFLISIAALAVFVLTVALLPIDLPSPSTVGEFLADCLGTARGTTCGPASPISIYALRNGAFVQDNIQLSSSIITEPIFMASTNDRTFTCGFWAPTCEVRNIFVVLIDSIDPGPQGKLSPAQTQTLRAMYVDQIAASDPAIAPDLPALRTADVRHTRILWSGVLHNALSLISFAVFLIALVAFFRRAVRFVRATLHLCPHCAYDLSATPANLPCPECGQPRV